ncbi:VOC family protein [bacterium]|nr:VOC family protein [bacterium]
MKYICSLIVVKNIKKARTFYEQILGQTVKFDFGENVTFEGSFAIHQQAHYQGLLNTDKETPVSSGAHDHELYFETDVFDESMKILESHGVEYVHGATVQPWGQRVVRFYDPDKHIVEIGETMETVIIRLSKQGFSQQEIIQKTMMPEPFVKITIEKL